MANVNLSSINASCIGKPNPAGVQNVFVQNCKSFATAWPKVVLDDDGEIDYSLSDIDEDGNVKNLPVLKDGAKWAQYDVPRGTARAKAEATNTNGYMSWKHTLDLSVAGFSKPVRKEMNKHLNLGSVFILQLKGSEFVVVATSEDPVFGKVAFDSGAGGQDKRGFTYKGEADNIMHGLLNIPNELLADFDIEPLD